MGMDAMRVYALLQQACRLLEEGEEHAIAAYVGHAMTLIDHRYRVAEDQRNAEGDR